MKNLILLILSVFICSCGVKVYKDDKMWVCRNGTFTGSNVFRFENVNEANEMCHALMWSESPTQMQLNRRISK